MSLKQVIDDLLFYILISPFIGFAFVYLAGDKIGIEKNVANVINASITFVVVFMLFRSKAIF